MIKTNNSNTDPREIVKTNFMIATFDAMNFDYFSPNYERNEELLERAMRQKVETMPDEIVEIFMLAIVDGSEIRFDIEKEDFFIE